MKENTENSTKFLIFIVYLLSSVHLFKVLAYLLSIYCIIVDHLSLFRTALDAILRCKF